MREIADNEFAWEFFESTGNIESYLIYKEYNNSRLGTEADEYDTNHGTGAENLQHER